MKKKKTKIAIGFIVVVVVPVEILRIFYEQAILCLRICFIDEFKKKINRRSCAKRYDVLTMKRTV